MKITAILAILAVLVLAVAPAFGQDVPVSLLSNGDFQAATRDAAWPDDWPKVEGATWEKEDGRAFLRLSSPTPGQMVLLYRQVTLPLPAPAAVELRLRVRYTDIKPGEKPWFDGRVISHFKDEAGEIVKPEPGAPNFRGSSKGWVDQSSIIRVPAGARVFEIMPCLFQAASGTLDFAKCEVLAAGADKLPKPPPIVPSVTLPLTLDAKRLPAEIHTAGNQLLSADGKPVWLQGLCVDSLQWSVAGEHIQQSIPVAIEQWKANVLRLPVTEQSWFGRGKGQKDGGLAYRKVVDAAVEAAASRGTWIAIDLHRFGAPMPRHVEFWKDVATRYQNHPAVLFEVFNEAHGISWQTWRDGGSLRDPANRGAAKGEADGDDGEQCVGMQAMLNAIRQAGAHNVVIVGGLDWGYDLSGLTKGFALEERAGGHGILYSSHIYPWKKDWPNKVLAAAAKFPIFVGEVGCPGDWKGFEFIPPSARPKDLPAWAADVLGMIQKNKLHWTGFSFHPKTGPMVISDWSYTPTPYWGTFVKEALSGKQFELKEMR